MDPFAKVLDFAARLDAAKIGYELAINREDMIMFTVAVPGELWEVEFAQDGSVDVEIFRSGEEMKGEGQLAELFEQSGP